MGLIDAAVAELGAVGDDFYGQARHRIVIGRHLRREPAADLCPGRLCGDERDHCRNYKQYVFHIR